MSRLIIICASALLLVGCGNKVEPEVTESYLDATQVTFDVYDDVAKLTLDGGEAFKVITDTEAILVGKGGTEVVIDYVQGNSLNDYIIAYHDALDDSSKTDVEDSTFTTATSYYGFKKGVSNDYVIVRGPVKEKKYCNDVLSRVEMEGANE